MIKKKKDLKVVENRWSSCLSTCWPNAAGRRQNTWQSVLARPTSSCTQLERTAAWTAGDSPEESFSLGTDHGLPGAPQNPTGQSPEQQSLKPALLWAGGQVDQTLLEVSYNPNLSVVLWLNLTPQGRHRRQKGRISERAKHVIFPKRPCRAKILETQCEQSPLPSLTVPDPSARCCCHQGAGKESQRWEASPDMNSCSNWPWVRLCWTEQCFILSRDQLISFWAAQGWASRTDSQQGARRQHQSPGPAGLVRMVSNTAISWYVPSAEEKVNKTLCWD